MALELGGLHHVTAVTAHAPENLRFYTEVLGLRLVKKTVNQDDVSAYHLFYGDELGRAGTEVTFFDWAMAAPNHPGHGEVSAVGLRVPDRAAFDWWAARFDALGVPHGEIVERGGRAVLAFTDPEGQRLQLVDESGAVVPGGVPWARGGVPSGVGIRGLGTAKLTVARPERTASVLTEVLGFRQTAELPAEDGTSGGTAVYEVGLGGPGATVLLEARPDLARARQGRGGVHHVAFRTPTFEEHEAWQRRIAAAGLGVTPIIDRYYFRSIYFREPGGVLFEIATDGPGFATDEDAAHLGETLALPPFLEPHRARIEAGLRPLPTAAVAAGRTE
ncbi:MAG TPA: ring-cleaving dioxygenase [Thermomicrobiaceae bacterium]|nr:ring-cleaving dioxygenase [Thermomicrobiaceae bacterium]